MRFRLEPRLVTLNFLGISRDFAIWKPTSQQRLNECQFSSTACTF